MSAWRGNQEVEGTILLCGHKQIKNLDYFDTWAPLVNWTTVQLLLILSVILDLAMLQANYTAAFVRAPIDDLKGFEMMTPLQKEVPNWCVC